MTRVKARRRGGGLRLPMTQSPRHLLDTQDLSPTEIARLLDLTAAMKAAARAGACPPVLAGASLGMIFEEPSTRTRVSFEVAMTKLGGHALYLRPGEIHLGARESVADTARVLGRMVDVIEARTLKHETVLGIAANAGVPVINGLTDLNHPTQALCDLFTMREHLRPGGDLAGLRVVFVGDATNVCQSLMMACTRMGVDFTHAAPYAYQAPEAWRNAARENIRAAGGRLEVTEDVRAAVAEADVIYTDLWWWIGQEAEIPDRERAFMPGFQVNETLLAQAPGHVRVMHCLPASRGVEITDAVLDGPRSIAFEQAENRLYTEMALLAWLTADRLKRPSSLDRADHAVAVKAALDLVQEGSPK